MTRRNKLLAGALSLLTVAQFCCGIYNTVIDGMSLREFLNRLFVRVLSHRSLAQPVPKINLDAYEVCLPKKWRPGELISTSISVTFGTPLPSGF